MRYRAVYAGDTGADHGLFYGGNYATVEEAVEAVRKGLEACYCHASFGYVWDEENNRYVVMFSGGGDVIYDAREEESK